MRLRTTITASVLTIGIVFGGASTALAHDHDDHCRKDSYGRDHDRDHGRDYGRDHGGKYGHDYGRDHDRGYGRDHGRDHDDKYGRGHGEDGGYKKSCHTAAGSNASKGSFYEHDCDSGGWSKKGHHETY